MNTDASAPRSEVSLVDRLAIALILLSALVLPIVFVRGNGTADVEGYELPKLLVVYTAALLAAGLTLVESRRIRVRTVDVAFLAFLVLGVVSTGVCATNRHLAWRASSLAASGLLFFATARALSSRGQGARVLLAVCSSAVLTAILILVEAHGLAPSLSLAHRAPGGGHGNRNYAAHLIAFAIPVLAAGVARARRRADALLAALGLALSVAALVLTRCRGAWLAMLVAAPVLLVLARGRLRRPTARHGLCAAAILLGLLLAWASTARLWNSPEAYAKTFVAIAAYDTGSGRGRLLQHRTTLRMVAAHPLLGVGPGNWTIDYPRFAAPGDPSYHPNFLWQTPSHATSDWMGLAAERGIPAALIFVVMLGLCGLQARRAGPDGELVIGLLVLLGVMAALDCVLALPVPTFAVFLTLGALLPGGAGRVLVELGPRQRRGLALALVLLATQLVADVRDLRGCVISVRAQNADDWAVAAAAAPDDFRVQGTAAQALRNRGDCVAARSFAKRALALNPQMGLARRVLDACPGLPQEQTP